MQSVQSFLVFLITFYLILEISKWFKVSSLDASKIFLFRSIICLAYIPIAENMNNDAYGYYLFNEMGFLGKYVGTDLIHSITYFLRSNFYLNFISCSLIFSFIGSIGSVLLYSFIKDLTKNSDRKLKVLAGLIVYLPIFNLWTASIGKDAITFTCINLIIFSFLNLNSRFLLLLISATLIALSRPYVGIILFFGLFIAIPQNRYLSLFKKLFFISGFSIILVILLSYLNTIFGQYFTNFSIGELFTFYDTYQNFTFDGETAIDTSSYGLPYKTFTYLFRHFLFESGDLFTVLMSIEYTILLSVVFYPFLISIKNKKFRKFEINTLNVFLIIFFLGTLIPYASSTSNLGLAYRHKLTLVPCLLYLSLSKQKNKILKSRNL